MATNNSIKVLAAKLSLNNQEHVMSKAAENLRLLNAKCTAGSNMTDTSKVVLCLDLAATLLGTHVDQKLAVRYSGLKAPSYCYYKKIVENLLDMNNEQISVATLCATLQCSGAQTLAQTILDEYQNNAVDVTLPQYACAAVYHACRINKIKISKKQIIEKSRLKPAQWSKFDSDFSEFVNRKFSKSKKIPSQTDANVTDTNTGDPMEDESTCTKEDNDRIEVYEDWKRRMLFEAYDELKLFEKKEKPKENYISMTPRRSPRKTPQKYSPYNSDKSPKKGAGLRLLFP